MSEVFGAPTTTDAFLLLLLPLLAWSAGRAVLGAAVRVRVRPRPRPRPPVNPAVGRALSFLGFVLAFASGPAAAGTRAPVSPYRRTLDAAPPWSGAGGFPPPRPLARIEAVDSPTRTPAHPALHPERAEASTRTATEPRPLFPRSEPAPTRREQIEAAMARHPSGKAAGRRTHVVRAGESLWSIAEEIVGPDARAVARYWPRLHRANRATIGPNPDLIRPGQVLELPNGD